MVTSVKGLVKQEKNLSNQITENTEEMAKLKVENIKLKQTLSLDVFNVNSFEQ